MKSYCWLVTWCWLALVAFQGPEALGEEPTISVTGEASTKVVPNTGKLTFGIQARAKTVAAAAEEVDKKLAAVTEFLKSLDIQDAHIRTQVISIEPIFARTVVAEKGSSLQGNANSNPFSVDEPEPAPSLAPVGYTANRELTITVVDLKKFEPIYKGIIERGINRIRNVEFTTSNLEQIRKQLRLKAVEDARDKARAMANVLGAKLAAIQSMRDKTDSGTYSVPASRGRDMDDPFSDSSRPILYTGELEIESTVDIVFELGDAKLVK